MPVKKKQKTGDAAQGAAAGSASAPTAGTLTAGFDGKVNMDYLARVTEAVNVIKNKWPDIAERDPLPLSSATGLTGFLAPYDPEVFDTHLARDSASMAYQCGVNLFWISPQQSVTPYIPISESRVMELAASVHPKAGIFKYTITVAATFNNGASIPRGDVLRISPDEVAHAFIFRVAQRITANAPEAELTELLRTMLSMPVCFKRLDSDDKKLAEAYSIRNETIGMARGITHNARQTVYNIWGFKCRKEALGVATSAAAIAQFWAEHVTQSAGTEQLHKKTTIDACLTLHERLFSLPVCDEMIRTMSDEAGPDSAWNSIWKLQEVVYRCRTPAKIIWLMSAINDQLQSKKICHRDITVNSLKTGGRSHSDPILQQLKIKEYLLGQWLDSKHFPTYIKSKARETFASHDSYRQFNPLGDGVSDTTWLFQWPKAGKDLMTFLEGAIYASGPGEDALLRTAVKNGKTAQETLAWNPWAETMADISTELLRTSTPAAVAAPEAPAPVHDLSDDDEGDPSGAVTTASDKQVNEAADRLMRHLVYLGVEPTTQCGIADIIKASPLGTVQAAPESGNVLIMVDCNTYGETDSQPALRKCPMGKNVFDKLLKGVLEGRCGSAEPDKLQNGDIFMCVDAGKDRRRIFAKPLSVPRCGKDPDRSSSRRIMLHCTEASVRARRGRPRGSVKLTQTVHMIMNVKTHIPNRDYANFPGSNACDVFGPVQLDPPSSIPSVPKADKVQWLGKRRILAGGKADESDDEDPEDECDAEPVAAEQSTSDSVPLTYHALPVVVFTDLVEAFGVKHVIDLTPTALPLQVALLARGCSYFGLCGSEFQRDWIQEKLRADVVKAIRDPSSTLFDKRLTPAEGGGGPSPAPPPKPAPPAPTPAPPKPTPPAPPKPPPVPKNKGGGTPKAKGPPINLAELLAKARANMGGSDPQPAPAPADD